MEAHIFCYKNLGIDKFYIQNVENNLLLDIGFATETNDRMNDGINGGST